MLLLTARLFKLNVDVSQCDPDQMRRVIRDIVESMGHEEEEGDIGLYEFKKRMPTVSIPNP